MPDPAELAKLAERSPSKELFVDYMRYIVARLSAERDVTIATLEANASDQAKGQSADHEEYQPSADGDQAAVGAAPLATDGAFQQRFAATRRARAMASGAQQRFSASLPGSLHRRSIMPVTS